jgi:hypothetical protein
MTKRTPRLSASFTTKRTAAALVAALLALAAPAAAQTPTKTIRMEKLGVSPAPGAIAGVQVKSVLPGEIIEVTTDLVTITGPASHSEPASNGREVVWLFLSGKGSFTAKASRYEIAGETVARAPTGWPAKIDVAAGETLHALRIRRTLTASDKGELAKYPQNNVEPHVKKFSECPAYHEAIKSPKTTSRTLLPENYVPRMAVGTVETTGPDKVGAHRHPMLEQLFLGLKSNDITVTADEARANLTEFAILHIPLGSNHGAAVADGKKLHYVWMDFFAAKEGQEWLKNHKPIEPEKK